MTEKIIHEAMGYTKSVLDGKQCLGCGLYEQWCRQAEMLRRWSWSM